jgi:hypothetical protein
MLPGPGNIMLPAAARQLRLALTIHHFVRLAENGCLTWTWQQYYLLPEVSFGLVLH